jgi:hypothetical protein
LDEPRRHVRRSTGGVRDHQANGAFLGRNTGGYDPEKHHDNQPYEFKVVHKPSLVLLYIPC